MKRNIERQIEIGRKIMAKHPNAEMTMQEMIDIMNKNEDASSFNQLTYSISDAFLMGVAVGSRISK